MLFVAAIGLALGIGINAAPYSPLILVVAILLLPQIIVMALCAYGSIREERLRQKRDAYDSASPK
jgi:hypothetical protein